MSKVMLTKFLESYKKCLPKSYEKVLQMLLQKNNLIVHKPLGVRPGNHPLDMAIKVAAGSSPIKKGSSLFWLSASQAFSGTDLIGANVKDKMVVNNFLQEASSQHQILKSQDMKMLFKILIQIYANHIDTCAEQMPLYHFSNLIFNQANQSPDNQNNILKRLGLTYNFESHQKHINSHHLLNILKSNQIVVSKLYQIISNFIKTSNPSQFSNNLKIIRAQIRQVREHSLLMKEKKETEADFANNSKIKIDVVAPLLPSLKPSRDPNCIIIGKYFTHLRQSYFCVQALRQIKAEEQLTVPQKAGLNNYDRLIRYGYKQLVKNPINENNQYLLIINIMDPSIEEVQQIMSGDVELKRQILLAYDLKMRSFIKINRNGTIKMEDLQMLRILFGSSSQEQISQQNGKNANDKKIYKFINKFVYPSLNLAKMGKNKQVQVDKQSNTELIKSYRIIQQGQIQILNNFMQQLHDLDIDKK